MEKVNGRWHYQMFKDYELRKWMIKVRRQKQVEDDEFPMVASGRWRP